jgi:hypothetical protein
VSVADGVEERLLSGEALPDAVERGRKAQSLLALLTLQAKGELAGPGAVDGAPALARQAEARDDLLGAIGAEVGDVREHLGVALEPHGLAQRDVFSVGRVAHGVLGGVAGKARWPVYEVRRSCG